MFGRVVSGLEVVKMMENAPVGQRDKPLSPIVVLNCGELVLSEATPSPPPSPNSLCVCRRSRVVLGFCC